MTDPRRRLHPVSPLLRGGRLVTLVVAAASWRAFQDLGLRTWLLGVAVVGLVVVVGCAISWSVTGYHVVGRELRVYEGLLARRVRAIPLERVQSVEVVRPLMARVFGVAELRIEVVGAGRTEAPLAFLAVADAAHLRGRLLALGRAVAPLTPPPTVPEGTLHTVPNRMLVGAQLLRPHWWLLPLAIAVPIVYFAQGHDASFVAFASTVTGVLGVMFAPVRVLLAEWNFTIGTTTDGLRLHRGLTETRNQTVPTGRVQSLAVRWPLLWRVGGWVRCTLHVAGVHPHHRDDEVGGGSLVPVGTVETTERIIERVLPGFVLRQVTIRPVPARARWLAPLRASVLGCQLTPTAFVSRDGLLTRRLVIVGYARIQSVRIHQGPFARSLGLASVHVDTVAGGPPAAALLRDVREARAIADDLATRAYRARRPDNQAAAQP